MKTFLIIAYYWVVTFSVVPVISDPQINLLNTVCSQYNASNPSVFLQKVNASFEELRLKLSNGDTTVVAQSRGQNQVSAFVQCRNYLSTSDCLACFSAAEAQIRNCSIANGARVIYDGCSLRYESKVYLRNPGADGICDNRTISQPTTFPATVMSLLSDIVNAAPRINGFFASSIREVDNGGIIVYAVAQCFTLTQAGCNDCLNVAYKNIERCLPAAGGRALGVSCYLRYSDTAFFDGNQITDLTSFLRQQGEGSNKNKVIIGAVEGGVALILLVVAFIIWFRFCRRNPKRERKGDILGATELRGPVNHSYKDLVSATKNFSEEHKLGEGGFGDVYKGTLKNGKIVAVKRLAIHHSDRAEEDFETEVKLISNVHHRNLIRLLGCCNKRQELLLVYEYMANSSLDKFLFGNRHGTLNWKQRFDIIVGTARGLAYLHEEFHVCIIHRDIKSSNILLDDNFQPRIADFGVARLFPEDKSHINTRFAGTLGYTAPEYAIHGQLSSKVDTYSFGVVVLEIISGRQSNDMKREPTTQYLLEWAWKLYEDEMLMDLVDESLNSREYNTQEVQKVFEIALLCTQSSIVTRPTMSEVVVLLLSKGSTEYTLTRPTLVN